MKGEVFDINFVEVARCNGRDAHNNGRDAHKGRDAHEQEWKESKNKSQLPNSHCLHSARAEYILKKNFRVINGGIGTLNLDCRVKLTLFLEISQNISLS
jgi:hypothetical protein